MADKAQIRGDDAADHAPRPQAKPRPNPGKTGDSDQQDAPNYSETAKGRDTLKVEDVDSSNDEGAA